MKGSLSRAALLAQLHEERQACIQFVAVLCDEQRALTENDIGALNDITKRKTVQYHILTRLTERRLAVLGDKQVSTRIEAFDVSLDKQVNDSATREAWQALLRDVADARNLNLHNGALLASRIQRNRDALQIFLTSTSRGGLYGSDGRTHRGLASGRPLGCV